jgi:hypothetical protein
VTQPAPLFTRQPSASPDAARDVFGRITYLDADREVLSRCIPDSSTWLLAQFLAQLLPTTDNDIAVMFQTEYWMSLIHKGALALYSVAMFPGTHAQENAELGRHPHALHALLRSGVSIPQDQGPPAAMHWSLNPEVKAMVTLRVVDEEDVNP